MAGTTDNPYSFSNVKADITRLQSEVHLHNVMLASIKAKQDIILLLLMVVISLVVAKYFV